MPFPKEDERCTFTYVDGRRCRMCKIETHPYLCFYHWQRGQQANDAIVFASQLLEPGQQLNSPSAVANVLTGVFRLLAQGRLQARQAATLAYISQLVIQLLPHIQREQQATATARGETSDAFDTIQKDSFEEDMIKRMLSVFRGEDGEDDSAKKTPPAPDPLFTSSAALDDEEPASDSIPVPGTSISLPAPLRREPQREPADPAACASAGAATEPPASPPYGLTPQIEAQFQEAGRPTPEEELQRREERARDFGPPFLVTTASQRAELDGRKKKRGYQ